MGSLYYALANGWYLGQMGDYATCHGEATNAQFVLAQMNGDYNADFPFSRASFGKYFDFQAQVGLCFPKQCSTDEIKAAMDPLFTRWGAASNWSNTNISYAASSDLVAEGRQDMTGGQVAALIISLLLIVLIVVASIVECSKIGDKKVKKKEELEDAGDFRDSVQYNEVLIQRKSAWARKLMTFSVVKNTNSLNL